MAFHSILQKTGAFKALILVACISGAAQAHYAATGMQYSAQCCHGTDKGGDCFALPIDAVEDLGVKGWHVTFQSEKFGAINTVVSRDKKRDSEDGQFHFCAMWNGGEIKARCFYVPSVVRNDRSKNRLSIMERAQ